MTNAVLHTTTLNGTTVFTDECQLTKATGTTFEFNTSGQYLDKNIILNATVQTGSSRAGNANVTCISNNISDTISSTGTIEEPISGYYIGMVGSGNSIISTEGWMDAGALNASSTTKYFSIDEAILRGSVSDLTTVTTVILNNVTINTHNTIPSGKISLNTLKPVNNSALIDEYFIPIKADIEEDSTGTTFAITGTHTASIVSAGFAPDTLRHITNLSGEATVKTSSATSGKQYIPIPTANIEIYGSKIATVPTEELITTNGDNAINVAVDNNAVTITTVAPISGFFIATQPTAPKTENIPITITCNTAGYTTGTATEIYGAASTRQSTGTTYYVPLPTASPTFKGGAITATTAIIAGTNATFSNTDSSGISIQASGGAKRDAIQYAANVNGWLQKNNDNPAYAAGMETTWDGNIYYLTDVKLTNNHSFNITIPNGENDWLTFHFAVDNNGNTTIT